jgi:SAM-dependent methyltransferase
MVRPTAGAAGGRSASGARLAEAFWQIYQRQPPVPWDERDNLPWDEPAFSERMLKEHLDQSHGAASRRVPEMRAQVQRMLDWLELPSGAQLLDVTCGPGLYAAEFARAGLAVTGVDFGPASIRYAREHCAGLPCRFVQADVREVDFGKLAQEQAAALAETPAASASKSEGFDAAIYIYGQFTVLRPAESREVLRRIGQALKPGAPILLEVLDYGHFDKKNSNWWYTDNRGLWGDFPYLSLGERHFDAEQQASVERYYILNLETGELQTYGLADQAYTVRQMKKMLKDAGFTQVTVHPSWDGLALNDAGEWNVYVARKAG